MNLQGKTIFDFCDDKKVIHEIIGGAYSKEYYKGFPPATIAQDMMEYAFRTDNKELFTSAKKLYDKERDGLDKELEDASKEGLVID